jgi:RNA-binding protein
MSELRGFQRRALRGLAHGLEPIVHLGREGLSDSLLESLDEALLAHELIKVRFVVHKEERRELAAEMAERCGAELAGVVGHVAILYRPHPEPEKRRIVVPTREET